MNHSGLSEEEVKKLPCTWRSYFGNSFPVWKAATLDEGKRTLALAAEQALVVKHGAEGLAKMRRDEAAARENKRVADAARASSDATRKDMSVLMVTVSMRLAAEREPRFEFGDVVPKAQAKKVFGLTDADLKPTAEHRCLGGGWRGLPIKDLGPDGRSKSSYAIDDVLKLARRSVGELGGRKSLRESTPVLFLALQRLKLHHPELIHSATESALAKSRLEAAQLEAAAVAARKAADGAMTGMQKLERLLGSGASARGATAAGGATAARGVTSVKKGGLAATFAAQSTAKKAQKRPCKPAAQARDDGDDDECAESAASLAPRRKAAGRAAAKKVKYAEVDDDDSGSEFEGELR